MLSAIEAGGFEARVVGGAIRNSLLGRPVKDIDIATTALPDEIQALAQRNGFKSIATGIAHGTVTVICGATAFEVTTLRKDVCTDGRHAVVAFTDDWLSDASRRDFTINAMYCDRTGHVFDPVNGYADIEARQIRFVGVPEKRIKEDYLRSLRFFRFFAEYGHGAPDPLALRAIVQCRSGLQQLSGERIRQEFLKILIAPRAVDILQIMQEYGILAHILPVAPSLSHFARLCGSFPESQAVVRLAVLSVHCAEDSERIAEQLRLSNAEAGFLKFFAQLLPQKNLSPNPVSGRRWYYQDGVAFFSARIQMMQSSSYSQLANPEWHNLHNLLQNWQLPTFPLSGGHIVAAGIQPGPDVGRILTDLKREWIESDFALTEDDLRSKLQQRLSDEVQ